MNENFYHPRGFESEKLSFDECYPEEVLEAIALSESQAKFKIESQTEEITSACETVSNDDFLKAIFGSDFTSAHPLVCKKSGDPEASGWNPFPWPCNTNMPQMNWYTLPGLYKPESSGRYRAQKKLAVSVHAVMVDDIGTKVSADRFSDSPPSWAIETSPGNYQYGYIFSEPITNLEIADQLKERLIEANLCDSGATGGAARWMRLPNAINGRSKYGTPSPKCRLVQWRPELQYSVEDLYSIFGLHKPHATQNSNEAKQPPHVPTELTQLHADANSVIDKLKAYGLYKRYLGAGKHDITCPWLNGHTDSIDNGSVYFEPTEQHPTGGFKCHHSHGHLFHLRELKEFLGIEFKRNNPIDVRQPQKLPPALRPVPALNATYLPNAISAAVVDLSDRLQCPPDYLAVSMLSAAGAVIGNSVGIFPYANDESWEVYPALWGGIVGDPGSKKSPALQHSHSPLQHLDEQASIKYSQDLNAYDQAKDQYEQALKSWNAKKSTGAKPTAPVEPKRERYVVHDSTYQALGVILADNPRGVLALADELSGLLQSLDTPGQEAARGFYLTGWSGTGGYSFDRVGRGSISLNRYCLSVFGGFQPDRVKSYVQFSQRGNSKNDGLLQRFQLLVWPDPLSTINFVDRLPNQSAIGKYHQAILNLPSLDKQALQGARRLPNGSQLLHFSPNAQQAFNAWFVQNEKMLSSGLLDPAKQSHFAKYRSLVPALALLFHLLDGHTGPVCENCLSSTLSFAKYLKKHAERIYASVSGHDHATVRMLAERLLDGQLPEGFTCRTLTLKGWSGLANKEQAQAAIDALVEYGWLIETEIRSGGRPTVKYALNSNVSVDLL